MKTKIIIALLLCIATSAIQAQERFKDSATGKYGYKDQNGNIVIKPKYDDVSSFSEGMATVMLDNKYGFINEQGREVIPPIYDNAIPFQKGQTVVSKDDKFYTLDKLGNEVKPKAIGAVTITTKCTRCNGLGVLQHTYNGIYETVTRTTTCYECHGTGTVAKKN